MEESGRYQGRNWNIWILIQFQMEHGTLKKSNDWERESDLLQTAPSHFKLGWFSHDLPFQKILATFSTIQMCIPRTGQRDWTAQVQPPVGFWDPLGLSSDGDLAVFKRRREVELKHGRSQSWSCHTCHHMSLYVVTCCHFWWHLLAWIFRDRQWLRQVA